jgi:hypothetical protein
MVYLYITYREALKVKKIEPKRKRLDRFLFADLSTVSDSNSNGSERSATGKMRMNKNLNILIKHSK